MSCKKVIISACLLGEACRYDGKSKKVNKVIEAYKDYEVIPFCPEAPIFGTPRERINVVRIDNENKIITENTNKDVTKLLENEISLFIKQNLHVDEIVLKSKSPSCGFETTPIFNCEKEIIAYGNGLAAEIFSVTYKNIKIKDEHLSI